MARPVITFLSDFGYGDEFVGVCHGVIATRCPCARIIDITHGIPRHDIYAGAVVLRAALAYMPAGVHLAVVDPGVGLDTSRAAPEPTGGALQGGGARRAVALVTSQQEQLLVGPDNGLLWLAAEQLGGVVEALDISASGERLHPVSATFHGRDVFAPVAAALACGKTPAGLGERIAVEDVARLALSRPDVEDRTLRAHVLHVDHFGNLTLDVTHAQLEQLGLRLGAQLEVSRAQPPARKSRTPSTRPAANPAPRAGRDSGRQAGAGSVVARYERTFGEVGPGELVVHEDSRRMIALAVNEGTAAELLGVGAGDEVILRPR